MMSNSKSLLILIIFIFTGCEEKMKPVVTIAPQLKLPIKCLSLNSINMNREIHDIFKKLYNFDEQCPFSLSVTYKKDIVCNSTQNIQMKSVGRFPKSYIKLEVRKGMDMKYTYYLDLYDNIEEEDMREGFERLKKDLLRK